MLMVPRQSLLGYMKKLLLKIIITVFCLYYFVNRILNPRKFACSNYPSIKANDINKHLISYPQALNLSIETGKPMCDVQYFNESNVSEVEKGGSWKPKDCIAKYQIAIIIPYRNRPTQLKTFIAYIHPFLQKQMLDYIIIVVEQTNDELFNRGKLFNVGFTEALKIKDINCFIFHDIDLLPESLENIYACSTMPRHMASNFNTFRYNLPYLQFCGGVVSITKEQYELVNGFSNDFYGWGGEDDDFYNRIILKGLSLWRFEKSVSRYYMLPHNKETPNEDRYKILESGTDIFGTDGINYLYYNIKQYKLMDLYTWILVEDI